MALTPKELQIAQQMKQQGKSKSEIAGYIGGLRLGRVTPEQKEEQKDSVIQRIISDAPSDVMETGESLLDTFNTAKTRIAEAGQDTTQGEQTQKRGLLQTIGLTAGALSKGVGDVVTGAGKLFTTPEAEKATSELVSKAASPAVQAALEVPEIKSMVEQYQNFTPEQKRDLDAILGGGSLALEILTAGAGGRVAQTGKKVIGETAETLGRSSSNLIAKAGSEIESGLTKVSIPESASGIIQTGKELAERFPRALSNIRQSSEEATARAARIKQSSPAVAEAIKKGVDDKFINAVTEADVPTRQAYKKVLDIAEETPKVGSKQQPTIIGGELASKQFDLINKQKKAVGKKIGDTVKELSKTTKLDVSDSVRNVDDILANQGIGIEYTKKGPKLNFTGTKYTPAERTKIQELYNLATEGGTELTPQQIYLKDQLFSKLQRESKFEGIGDLFVNTPEGDSSLFRVFRDIYSSKLDEVSPEIKQLNREYRNVATLVEDLEDSIFKTPNFNVTKTSDPSEFAKVNLRRIFGESQSSPAFEAVADKMDQFARSLGYEDAKPKDVAAFAQEIRELYPDTIPSAGFSGGIKLGITDILEKVSKVGGVRPQDRQRALRKLIESLATDK